MGFENHFFFVDLIDLPFVFKVQQPIRIRKLDFALFRLFISFVFLWNQPQLELNTQNVQTHLVRGWFPICWKKNIFFKYKNLEFVQNACDNQKLVNSSELQKNTCTFVSRHRIWSWICWIFNAESFSFGVEIAAACYSWNNDA